VSGANPTGHPNFNRRIVIFLLVRFFFAIGGGMTENR
jgi:hypothetical protein